MSGQTDMHTPFLGPQPRLEKPSAYAKKSTAKFNMPESYIGESLYLRDTMEDWMFTANWKWYTERVMPWYRTDNIHLQWTEWENNAHYMGITPHQATSNVTTQKRTIRKADMLRRGIAAEFEHDFVQTALGRTSFMASLAQIARSVQETANVEVLRSLLGCHRYQQAYVRLHGIIKDGELDQWWQRKVDRFMICQKGDFGMEHMNTLIDQEQEKYQAQSNVWILGREVMDYCSNVPPGKIYYSEGGQEAVDRINGRGQNGVAAAGTMGNVKSIQPERLVAGCPVFLAKSYVVDSVGQADLLSRTTEVGIFNSQVDQTRNYKEYTTDNRTIRVYDEDIDDWVELTLQDSIENCIIWDTDGGVTDPFTSNGRNGTRQKEGIRQQVADDFLRYNDSNGTPLDVEYIGDMDQRWLSTAQLLGAGQTVINALTRQGVSTAGLTDLIDSSDQTKNPQNRRAAGLDGTKGTAFAAVVTATNDILGNDNLFFNTGTAAGESATNLYKTFGPTNAQKKALLQTSIGAAAATEVSAELAETKHREFLNVTIGSLVPAAHRAELAAIVDRTDAPWKERIASIQTLILTAFVEDPSSVKALKSADAIKQWIRNRVDGYEQSFASWSAAQIEAAASAAASSLGDDIDDAPAKKRFPTTLRDMPWLSHVFASSGSDSGRRGIGARVSAPPTGITISKEALAARFNNVDKHIVAIANSSAPRDVKWMALFFLGCRFNKQRLLDLANMDIWVPFNALHLRPHCTYRTRYGIKCADQGNSGYTFFGHSDMQIEHEAARKVGMMHYTAYLSAVVIFPKNVYVVEDLYCEKYLGGMGSKFWSVQDYLSKQSNRRLASIICTALPPIMKDRLQKKLDVRGHWYTEQRSRLVDAETFARTCYPGAARTAAIMGWWDPIRQSKGLDQSHRSRNVNMNFVCFQGVQFSRNPKTGDFSNVTIEQGHFGPNVEPGSDAVRNGALKFQGKASYLGGASRHGN